MTQAWPCRLGVHHPTRHNGIIGARLKTKTTMPSRKSICLRDIFHWGETGQASVGSCGVLWLMGYQEKGDWISWTAQRALGLPEKSNRLLRWKASVFAYLPFGCLGLWLLSLRKMAFSSVITDGPDDSESSNSESFQAILAVKVEHFSKTRARIR